MYEKIVLITRKTRLTELVEKFNSRGQAKFYIEHSGGNFSAYQEEDDAYNRSLEKVHAAMDIGLASQVVKREYLSNFVFGSKDLVIALGQDGLVANLAKYTDGQPIIGVNPDPKNVDGILVPFSPMALGACLEKLMQNKSNLSKVTLAQVTLNDGQSMLAFNDFFIGAKTHVSARYRLQVGNYKEVHSSSGIIVSTGAGATGWLSSVFNMLNLAAEFAGNADTKERIKRPTLALDKPELFFVVREPFVSKSSSANLGMGLLKEGQELIVESNMPLGGTIFSDGVESDFLNFTSGYTARVRAADKKAILVKP